MILNSLIILVILLLAGYLAFSKRLENSANWQAIVTPLASIMGSGFLVSAPLLAGVVGHLAVVFMGILLAVAYAVGSVIRFNIRNFEPIEHESRGPAQIIAFISRIVLAGAYFISVTYYLQLLAAFMLSSAGMQNEFVARLITTALLVLIAGVGIWQGLATLEKIETYTVSLNLGMIGALLFALIVYNTMLFNSGEWQLPDVSSTIHFRDIRVILGLLIIVQGFETSRYLGSEHPADLRITTMRYAQLIASAIYLIFLALATVLFQSGLGADVTAIIKMIAPVAVVLPILLAIAAIGSQFSAAVADTAGAGGLVEDITEQKLKIRYAYLLILCITVALTWITNVNEIIAYASRAFALYYTLQSSVAFLVAYQKEDLSSRTWHLVRFAIVAIICLLVFVLGVPSE